MTTMPLDPEHTEFLRPTALMYELLVLDELNRSGYCEPPRSSVRGVSNTMVAGALTRFSEAGWTEVGTENGERVHRLTATGEQRLQTLMVDYMQELIGLYGQVQEVFRKRLAEFYFGGARRVAFYPIGETAEIVYRSMEDTGLVLALAIDDDPARWGTVFHGMTVQPRQALVGASVDAVIVTTCAFGAEVARNLSEEKNPNVKVLRL